MNQVNKIVAKSVTLHTVTATTVGLGNVDNTSDVNKPVSVATQTALNLKVDNSTDQFTVNETSSNSGIIMKALADSPSFTDDIAAFTAGVELGELYRTYNVVKIRLPLATFLRTDGLSRFLRPDGISSFVRG